jgi:hypothetical protein
MRTSTPLTIVSPHVQLLLLKVASLKLQAYAPTYNTLIDPPYKFAPKDPSPLVVKALQFEHAESLTCTDKPIADVASQVLLLLLEAARLKLQAYAPTYNTLIDPPYEFAPKDAPDLLVLKVMQFQHAESLTCADTSLADVASHLLLLLLDVARLKLQAYAPTYNTLIDPPYKFAPKDRPALVLRALQFQQAESLTCTIMPFADVASHLLLLLLEVARLKLQAYAPTYNTLIDPPYEFAPFVKFPLVDAEALELSEEVFRTRTSTPLTFVAPQVLLLLPPATL